MATGGRKPAACSKMLISHLVNCGRNFSSSLLCWQNGLGTAWPGREPHVKRPETALCPFESAIPHPTPSQSLQEFHKVLTYTWGQFCSSSFLNDLPSSVSSRTFLYADDALEYEIGAPPSTISLQRSIDHTKQWAAYWHGTFSSCKTDLLLVGRQTSADDQVTTSRWTRP